MSEAFASSDSIIENIIASHDVDCLKEGNMSIGSRLEVRAEDSTCWNSS
jgi:hypothetical protein